MADYFGFGNGSDGAGSLSGTMTPVDGTLSITSGSTSGTTSTGKTFAAGDIVLLHQSQGTNYGNKQINIVSTYNSGTGAITFQLAANVTYGTGAQLIKAPQYSSITLAAALTIKAWTGTLGGWGFFVCNGDFDGGGYTLNAGGSTATTSTGASGGGFRGGNATSNVNAAGGRGEGHSNATTGTGTGNQRAALDNGGGGTLGVAGGGASSSPSAGGGGGPAAGRGRTRGR